MPLDEITDTVDVESDCKDTCRFTGKMKKKKPSRCHLSAGSVDERQTYIWLEFYESAHTRIMYHHSLMHMCQRAHEWQPCLPHDDRGWGEHVSHSGAATGDIRLYKSERLGCSPRMPIGWHGVTPPLIGRWMDVTFTILRESV